MPSNITCPSCGHAFGVVATATVPDSQRIKMKITSESPFFAADQIGKAIVTQTNVLKEVARSIDAQVEVFISAMVCREHEVEIEFLVVAKRRPADAD